MVIVEKKEIKTIPSYSVVVSDDLVSDEQTERRVLFKNGDIAVFKVIFSWRCNATAEITCKGKRKKTLKTRAITESWKRLKKIYFHNKNPFTKL